MRLLPVLEELVQQEQQIQAAVLEDQQQQGQIPHTQVQQAVQA